MNMVSMKTLKPHRYGKDELVAGDTFSAHPRDVKLLKVLGRAVEAEAEPQKVAPARAQQINQRQRSGRYNRRDQRARS